MVRKDLLSVCSLGILASWVLGAFFNMAYYYCSLFFIIIIVILGDDE